MTLPAMTLGPTDKYCPHCHHPIVRVEKTGFEYCSHPCMEICDYEVKGAKTPPILGRDARDRSVSRARKQSIIERCTGLLNTYMKQEGKQATIDGLYVILKQVLEKDTQ